MTTNITYVCPSQNASDQRCYQIIQELDIEFSNVETIEELFPLLSDPKFRTDLIVIDIERFYNNPGVDVFDIIHTLATLIKCTVERTGAGKPLKRQTQIIAVADQNTTPALIKEMLSYSEIKTVALRACTGVLSLVAGSGITLSASTGSITVSSVGADIINTTGVTANYTATDTDEYIGVNSTSLVTITLPPGVDGRQYVVKEERGSGTGRVNIQGTGNEKLDGNSFRQLSANASISVVFRAGAWRII